MPSFIDLSLVSGSAASVGLIVTAACIVLIADWRLALFALSFQYVLLTLLLATVVQFPVATVRLFAGGLAATILYLTMRNRVDRVRRPRPDDTYQPPLPPVFIVGFPFRFFAVALVAVAIIGFSSSMTFLSLPPYLLFGSLWLLAIGLLVAMLSRDALRLGLGILVFTGGFSILDTAIERSLLLYGVLNIADLLIALVVSHLATLSSEPGDSHRWSDWL